MGQITQFTTKTRLKTVPASEDLKLSDPAEVRNAKLEADLAWQMNLAELKLRALKGQNLAARQSLNGFHDTARDSLGHAQRAISGSKLARFHISLLKA